MAAILLSAHDDFMNNAVSITETLLGAAGEAIEGITKIGIGIASIFLLVVVFVYVTNILDGGKFQAKMLLPLLIYLAVCNFRYVAGPVVKFGLIIQKECVAEAHSARMRMLGDPMDGGWTIFRAFLKKIDEPTETVKRLTLGEDFDDTVDSQDAEGNRTGFFSGLGDNIVNALKWFWNHIVLEIVQGFTTSPLKVMTFGLMGLVAELLDFIVCLLDIALTCLGAVMTALVVAFGPITWAFAVFPGNQRTLGAWALRICQFMLYSPIVQLIGAFFAYTLLHFTDLLFKDAGGAAGSAGAIMGIAGLLLANIAALMSVPAIASMIIEGAQGAITLSQGLMTASSITQIGETFRDRRMEGKLDKLGGSGGGAPSPSPGSPAPGPGVGGGPGSLPGIGGLTGGAH